MSQLEEYKTHQDPKITVSVNKFLKIIMDYTLVDLHVFGNPKRVKSFRQTFKNNPANKPGVKKRKGAGGKKSAEASHEDQFADLLTTVGIMDVERNDILMTETDTEARNHLLEQLAEAQKEHLDSLDFESPCFQSYPDLIIRPLKAFLKKVCQNAHTICDDKCLANSQLPSSEEEDGDDSNFNSATPKGSKKKRKQQQKGPKQKLCENNINTLLSDEIKSAKGAARSEVARKTKEQRIARQERNHILCRCRVKNLIKQNELLTTTPSSASASAECRDDSVSPATASSSSASGNGKNMRAQPKAQTPSGMAAGVGGQKSRKTLLK
jgi:hypothetical protein